MPDRKSPLGFWLSASLLLAAFVLFAPILASGTATSPTRPHLTSSPILPIPQISATATTDNVLQMTDLPAENEEQDRADAPDEPRVPFLIPSSFPKLPDHQTTARPSTPSLYPLRC